MELFFLGDQYGLKVVRARNISESHKTEVRLATNYRLTGGRFHSKGFRLCSFPMATVRPNSSSVYS